MGRCVSSSLRTIGVACLQIGVIESAAGMFVYFVIFAQNGFWPKSMFGLQSKWEDHTLNNLLDSYGQEWVSHNRPVDIALPRKHPSVISMPFLLSYPITLRL